MKKDNLTKIFVILFTVFIITNPVTGMLIQTAITEALELIIINAGYIITLIFCAYALFYIGVLYARIANKEKNAETKKIVKAEKSGKRNLGGMQYEQ